MHLIACRSHSRCCCCCRQTGRFRVLAENMAICICLSSVVSSRVSGQVTAGQQLPQLSACPQQQRQQHNFCQATHDLCIFLSGIKCALTSYASEHTTITYASAPAKTATAAGAAGGAGPAGEWRAAVERPLSALLKRPEQQLIDNRNACKACFKKFVARS